VNILVIHGPNLNLLGMREPSLYGYTSLADINQAIEKRAIELGASVRFIQSSSEGEIVDGIHEARDWATGIVINPAAYTHYSIAIRDALLAVGRPTIEVHLSNIYAREPFRHTSVVSGVVKGVISGLGYYGYLYALEHLCMVSM
jgi:3-dehydroquinate dehydratase II